MISIRTALVAAAFAAMGLTSVAEHFAEKATAQADPTLSVEIEEAMPAKAIRLAQKIQRAPVDPDLSPWI